MENLWSENEASAYLARYSGQWGQDLALRTYSSRLLGRAKSLVLHGGGNTSVKGTHTNIFGETVPAIYVKASGYDLAGIEPEGHPGLDLAYLRRLGTLPELSDFQMLNEFRSCLLDPRSVTPSIETLVHAFLPQKYIDHTHADAILALTNQVNGEQIIADALGSQVIVLEYVKPGFKLAQAARIALEAHPDARAMVWMHHGLVTWGDTAQASYSTMIELVTLAEQYIAAHGSRRLSRWSSTSPGLAEERVVQIAPIVRGLLSQPTQDPDHPYQRIILRCLCHQEILDFVDSDQGKMLALTSPLTTDHLIRTKALPLWIDGLVLADQLRLREQLGQAIREYSEAYGDYVRRQAERKRVEVQSYDAMPRVILIPGVGALCVGEDTTAAGVASDITVHTLRVKAEVAAMGVYRGLSEDHLYEMEYDLFQQAKRRRAQSLPLSGQIAIVTGAAGAIGSGIVRELLQQGSAVAACDLPGVGLTSLVAQFGAEFGERIMGVPFDVTDQAQVAQGFARIVVAWGGVDIVVANAGIALVAPLARMDVAAFRQLEQVNVEGTLHMLAEAARLFERQGTGGDIILVSTKNVFAPGAKFGAYSATKAAAHQLARIASLELAEMGVRVNMVAPDAVFGEGARKSGLWAAVGPDRMKERGLDEKGLEEYYRNRNLLKARITPKHVANALLYFATRQTPTTGATIPVDGGLPDATPR